MKLNNLVAFYKHIMIGNLYSDLDTVSKCWASMYAYRRYSLTTESSSLLLSDFHLYFLATLSVHLYFLATLSVYPSCASMLSSLDT